VSGVRFVAPELRADGTIAPATWGYEPVGDGWRVRRDGTPVLELGPGYRLLRTSHAGICATDLARVHLPFPLPQVTGHEVVALDDGRPVLIEINASHRARALPRAAWCPHCLAGLDTHCPARLVLGIDRLVGGFAPWLLVPAGAVVPVPAGMEPATAVLAEPFAAAWHAAETIDAADGMRVAVLGLGRLGLLLTAALDAWRRARGRTIEIVGLARRPERAALARTLGADAVGPPGDQPVADVVVDATGVPDGLGAALAMARVCVHLKSTSGAPAAELADPTALVVDELRIAPWRGVEDFGTGDVVAVLAADARARLGGALAARGARVVAGEGPAALAARLEREAPLGADAAVVDSPAGIDALVRPRGRILLAGDAPAAGPLGEAVVGRRVAIETSRCGSIPAALPALAAADARLAAAGAGSLGRLLVTATLPAARLAEGYALAARPEHCKVLVTHGIDAASAPRGA
jgi:threonine dehydrogenase-like Zn-dependent dehydrogenase